MRPVSDIYFYRLMTDFVNQVLKRMGISELRTAKIPASYVSGNPTVQQDWESASTMGSKTHKIFEPFSNRAGAPAANQRIVLGTDPDGNRLPLGRFVDKADYKVDADYLMGLRPVAPGNTVLLFANTERSTPSTSFVTVKRFYLTRPGKYRIGMELSTDSGGDAEASLDLEFSDGVLRSAGSLVSENSVVYPTFGAEKTVDMNTAAAWGSYLVVRLRQKIGGGQTAYIQNVRVKYADATDNLAINDLVVTD